MVEAAWRGDDISQSGAVEGKDQAALRHIQQCRSVRDPSHSSGENQLRFAGTQRETALPLAHMRLQLAAAEHRTKQKHGMALALEAALCEEALDSD